MFDQRTSGRRLVRWKAAVIPLNRPDHIIQSHATEVAQKGISLFCKEQLFPHITYRIIMQIPDAMHISVSYVEVEGKPIFSSLVGSMGEFRTGMKLTDISNEYRSKIDALLRGIG
ncbi:hypothetical protein FNU76_03805 [Chitinimonas arctica]|uniref:Uncharacterized protein n=1 Tax=Chitinimonas arctica TaxID=2594795 RepID=A0A516SBM1_9NEIS|nr:hypothetical protein [Chitinimonas arctica]QDQ25547.1 hypothetical protein FNU76_03805 [Chitinimonas arctica]